MSILLFHFSQPCHIDFHFSRFVSLKRSSGEMPKKTGIIFLPHSTIFATSNIGQCERMNNSDKITTPTWHCSTAFKMRSGKLSPIGKLSLSLSKNGYRSTFLKSLSSCDTNPFRAPLWHRNTVCLHSRYLFFYRFLRFMLRARGALWDRYSSVSDSFSGFQFATLLRG